MPDISSSPQRTLAVILAAGQGTRMGANGNKVFLELAGKPLLVYAIEAFAHASRVDEALLVAHPQEVAYVSTEIVTRFGLSIVRSVITGGATRHQSEYNALQALRPRILAGELNVMLIHDGARPFVAPDDIDRLVLAAQSSGGALLAAALTPTDLLAQRTPDGVVTALLPTVASPTASGSSASLWRALTPQAFDAQSLLLAYDHAQRDGFEGSDTASSYERLGRLTQLVPGAPTNLKVTTPDDLVRAETLFPTLPWLTRSTSGR